MARKSRTEWEALVAEYEQSNLSQREFATRSSVNLGTFQSYLYQVRRDRKTRTEPTFIELSTNDAPVTVSFRGVDISFSEPPSVAWLLELSAAL